MSDGPALMLVGLTLLSLAAVLHLCVVKRFEGEPDMERDEEWNEVAELARGKLAAALDLPVARVEIDRTRWTLSVPLEGSTIPFEIEAVINDNPPGLRSKAAQWVSNHRSANLSVS